MLYIVTNSNNKYQVVDSEDNYKLYPQEFTTQFEIDQFIWDNWNSKITTPDPDYYEE